MKNLELLGAFKKDLKLITKRAYDRDKLDAIVSMLRLDEALPNRARPHKLIGKWKGFWECHVGPDWLLIYNITDTTVILARTGTHADLFE